MLLLENVLESYLLYHNIRNTAVFFRYQLLVNNVIGAKEACIISLDRFAIHRDNYFTSANLIC